MNRTKSE